MDVALSVDPRIKRIKQEEKEAREAKKKNRGAQNGANNKQKAEEEKKKAEEEAKQKEEDEKVCHMTTASVAQELILSASGCSRGCQKGQGRRSERCEEGEACCTRGRGWRMMQHTAKLVYIPQFVSRSKHSFTSGLPEMFSL